MTLKRPALIIFLSLVFLDLFFLWPKTTQSVEYQSCPINTICNIGEFLYDDSYAPIATASCTITSRYPDGTLFINSAPMIAGSNGWYSYATSSGSVQGIYPTQICCTADTDYLCLDKTFKVNTEATSSSITASDVWNYSDRSLTSFGTLVADIWSYSGRTLTSFGTLASDVWNYSSRSMSDFGNLVSDIWSRDSRTVTGGTVTGTTTLTSAAEIAEIKKIVKENRLLLEQLINKPIVKTFIDDTNAPNLQAKINQSKSTAENLYSSTQNLKSRSELLSEKWPELTAGEIKSELQTLSAILKEDLNQKDSNILTSTRWLKSSWNSTVVLNLSDQAQAAQSKIDNLINDINLFGSAPQSSFDSALSHIERLSDLVGTSLSSANEISLYGFIKKITDQVAFFDQQSIEVTKLLTDIKSGKNTNPNEAISSLTAAILAENQVPGVESLLIRRPDDKNYSTNKLLGLIAIIDTNKLLLAGNTGQAVKNIWLEEGSIVFRAVATNPSQTLTQKVVIKYYLPTELKKEQVISSDPELTIDYDPIENALFATGEISLSPRETRTFMVETEDIWSFNQTEIDSLKNQVNELVNVLKNTGNFAQATTIKGDIVVILDKIMLRQNQAVTPENRIRSYRESSLEMTNVSDKIAILKDLALQSNTSSGLFGFAGGIPTIALWGIIIIVLSGFVFLALYMRALQAEKNPSENLRPQPLPDPPSKPRYRHREYPHHPSHRILKIASIVLLTSGFGSLTGSVIIKASRGITPTSNQVTTVSPIKYPLNATLMIPETGRIPIRTSPSITSPEIFSIKDNQKIIVFRQLDDWIQLGLSEKDQEKGWWTSAKYLSSAIK